MIDPKITADALVAFGKGAWFHVQGLYVFVPETARSSDIDAAIKLLERVYDEHYVCETADQGGT